MKIISVYLSQSAEARRARLAAIHRKCLLLLQQRRGG